MTKPLDPILGPDGKRLWVTACEYIGAVIYAERRG